jgi:hypothetical protein
MPVNIAITANAAHNIFDFIFIYTLSQLQDIAFAEYITLINTIKTA